MMKRYAFAGASGRGLNMYGKPMVASFSDTSEPVGVYDPNYKRAAVFVSETKGNFPVFKDFDEMIRVSKPDTVIVTTQDAFHYLYTVKALQSGCDVIVEKPMTTDHHQCNQVLKAERETGKRVIVTFNCRYMPFLIGIKKLLMQNILGDITSVHYEWLLDQDHGADYFRRWHAEKKKSGGLQIHKCTHHFDMLNWLIDDEPRSVNAFGTLRFYGHNGPLRGQYCFTCEHAKSCRFYSDRSKNEFVKRYYIDAMDLDQYCPNLCLYRNEIDIEDSLSVSVRYAKGAVMSYTLSAFAPYEGYKIYINGTKGRMEIENYGGKFMKTPVRSIRHYNENHEMSIVDIEEGKGSHGGGDRRLQEILFRDRQADDPYQQRSGTRAGAMSAGIGFAINESMKQKQQIQLSDLLTELDL